MKEALKNILSQLVLTVFVLLRARQARADDLSTDCMASL